MSVRVERVVTSGLFTLDGESFAVDNNVWLLGDDREVLVVDAAHDAAAILAAVDGREVRGILCSHGHNDHIDAAPQLAAATGAPVALHPADHLFWQELHPGPLPQVLADEQRWAVAGVDVHVLHTPGHSPGAVCLYAPDLELLFSGDTLFAGGPGATGRSHSSFPTIVASIRDRLLRLPAPTRVLTGHGEATSIGTEAPDLDAWIARGH